MEDKEIQKIISDTVIATVCRLRSEGLLRDSIVSAYTKTEELLRQYPELCKVADQYAQRVVSEVDRCLADAKNEPYLDVIRLYYFEGNKNAACAKMLCCDERTARRNRANLVKRFSARLASEEFIRELLA